MKIDEARVQEATLEPGDVQEKLDDLFEEGELYSLHDDLQLAFSSALDNLSLPNDVDEALREYTHSTVTGVWESLKQDLSAYVELAFERAMKKREHQERANRKKARSR